MSKAISIYLDYLHVESFLFKSDRFSADLVHYVAANRFSFSAMD
jgi:hypothetical protein